MQRLTGGFLATCLLLTAVAQAQVVVILPHPPRPPVRPPIPTPVQSDYKIKAVAVQATVRDQAAKFQISQVFQNTGSATLEAQFIFPIPENAAISGLTLLVDGKELPGRLLKKDEARQRYEEIVRRQRDPALLEYMGQRLYQTSVFPIPAQAERTVEIRYDQLLRKDSGLVDLSIPIGTSKHANRPVDTLDVTIRVETAEAIKSIYSPTHQPEIIRPDATHAVCKLSLKSVSHPDDFRLFFGTNAGVVGTNILTYRPQANEDGYFLMLASPEVAAGSDGKTAEEKNAPASNEKTVVFVCDKSGSMSGKKIEQAKEAVKFVINQLGPKDMFNVVAYDSAVESFRPELQPANDATRQSALGFVDGLFAGGGTNINEALGTALKMLTDPKRPSYVLFMTDGIPTVGELDERKIAASAKRANVVSARLFSFGVGFDVNSRLLDRISRSERGQSIYVHPNENIEAQVANLYRKIGSPLLLDLAVNFEFDKPSSPGAASPITRTYPRQLTDLYRGEQLVLVGRYRQPGTAKVTLTGTLAGEKKSFSTSATFVEKSADESLGFVEKLWATRRIGEIIDELDLHGKNQELVDELVQLSLKHGIITPYTSFLADENTNLADHPDNARRARNNVEMDMMQADGRKGFAQRSFKGTLQRAATPAFGGAVSESISRYNALSEPESKDAKPTEQAVRNVGQKTFYRKQNQWQDSSVTPAEGKAAKRIVQYSKEYFDLAAAHGGTLAKYLVFNEPVLVKLADNVYQIDPPAEATP